MVVAKNKLNVMACLRQKFLLITFLILGLVALPGGQGVAAPPAPSRATILPDNPGWDFTTSGINNKGAVIGTGYRVDEMENLLVEGFVYEKGAYTNISPPELGSPWADVQLRDINGRGDIIGVAYDSEFLSHAFLYTRGVYTAIEVPGSAPNTTEISRLNDRGEIVGSFSDAESRLHAFVFDAGVYTTIDPPGSVFAYASDVNNRGQIVGQYVDVNSSGQMKSHGFIYHKGTFTSLDHPDVVQSRFTNGTGANLITERGQVVGSFYDQAFKLRPYVYNKGVYTTILIPNADYTFVAGTNARGQVVGTYGVDGINHGFLYENSAIKTIDQHGDQDGSGTVLTGINDAGNIIGSFQLFPEDFSYFYQYNFVLSR